jgi:neutral ceramidase
MRVFYAALVLAGTLTGADFKAGVARLKITPEGPIWLSGYAARKHASEGVVHDLWAKALALESSKGGRVVIVTTDLIGLPRAISELVAARVEKQYGLERARLVLNSSHTHTGPVLRANLSAMYDLSPEDDRRINGYSRTLTDALVSVVGAALGDLAPAQLWFGRGQANFAINRREQTAKGMRIGLNPAGATDHEVPVLRVTTPDGKLRAVLFGYACHNTTLGGDFYKVSGDYAGFAQLAFEAAHPGTTALFMELCGADQNPNPRGTIELAEKHGQTLAAEVDRALTSPLKRVRGPIRAAFQVIDLDFTPHIRETFEQRLNDPNPARVKNAQLMLKAYDAGRPIRRTSYPVQAVRFGSDLTLVALGGEVVVDYALRAKREFDARKEPLVVAGFSNDVMCYIPSLRVLKEGGYEPVDSMLYYGQPGPFAEDVEERVFAAVREVLRRVGRKGR